MPFSSDVKSQDSVLSQDSLRIHFGCLGLGLEGCCFVNTGNRLFLVLT